jgi:hypothetical protein
MLKKNAIAMREQTCKTRKMTTMKNGMMMMMMRMMMMIMMMMMMMKMMMMTKVKTQTISTHHAPSGRHRSIAGNEKEKAEVERTDANAKHMSDAE